MGWRVFSASVAGVDKRERMQPCQDASAHRVVGDRLVAVVCDGAGSAQRSDEGARLVSRGVVDVLAGRVDASLAIESSITHTRDLLEQHAHEHGAALADFASTIVGVVADPDGAWLFHLGDGVAAACPRAPGAAFVSPPMNGEYVNETFFLTGEAWRDHVRVQRVPVPLRSVLLMSDGVQPFAMNRGCTAPYEPFVGPVERFLLEASPDAGNAALAELLSDPRLDAITHDDKTLLIAQWRP